MNDDTLRERERVNKKRILSFIRKVHGIMGDI